METFKEISVGGVSKEQLINQLIKAGIQFNEYAKVLFQHPTFSSNVPAQKVTLVKVQPAELGLSNPYSLETAISRGLGLGLRPCPLHLAPFLR
jgi:hypothetical protein